MKIFFDASVLVADKILTLNPKDFKRFGVDIEKLVLIP